MTLKVMSQVATVVLLVTVVVCTAVSRRPAGSDITEGGSPLYGIAVGESIKGLSKKTDESHDGEVCSGCGKVHGPPDTAPSLPPVARGVGEESKNYEYCVTCKSLSPAKDSLVGHTHTCDIFTSDKNSLQQCCPTTDHRPPTTDHRPPTTDHRKP